MNNNMERKLTDLSGMEKAVKDILKQAWIRGMRYGIEQSKEDNSKGDLISREALKKKLQARHDNGEEDFDKGYNIGIETAMDLIDLAPTVEPYKAIHNELHKGEEE